MWLGKSSRPLLRPSGLFRDRSCSPFPISLPHGVLSIYQCSTSLEPSLLFVDRRPPQATPYPHSTLSSLYALYRTGLLYVEYFRRPYRSRRPRLFYRKPRGYLLNESICFRHASHIARGLILGSCMLHLAQVNKGIG